VDKHRQASSYIPYTVISVVIFTLFACTKYGSSSKVCSHPLYNETEIELNEGIKHAANRRALYECNLSIPIENLRVMQRIIYSRPMDHHLLGEHELGNYILISSNLNRQKSFGESTRARLFERN